MKTLLFYCPTCGADFSRVQSNRPEENRSECNQCNKPAIRISYGYSVVTSQGLFGWRVWADGLSKTEAVAKLSEIKKNNSGYHFELLSPRSCLE